nr:sensor histidine kinase [Parvularcula mediterranea]
MVSDVTPELRHLKARAIAAERRADQAVLELNHRVRNIMSVVTALISLSARYAEDVDAFSVATISRINALNVAFSNSGIDPLRPENIRQSVSMVTLANGIIGQNPLVTICREPLELSPGQASAMGLIIHELASNAHEHGAFTQGKTAELRWWHQGAHFGIEWIEPTEVKDADLIDGFGMTIVKHLTRSYLNGACAWDVSGGQLRVSVTGVGGGEARAAADTSPR